jgi:hypothetical protein
MVAYFKVQQFGYHLADFRYPRVAELQHFATRVANGVVVLLEAVAFLVQGLGTAKLVFGYQFAFHE